MNAMTRSEGGATLERGELKGSRAAFIKLTVLRMRRTYRHAVCHHLFAKFGAIVEGRLDRASQHSSNWSPNFSFIILIFSSQEAAAAPSRVLCRLADALFAGLRPESAAAVLSWVASRVGSGDAATPPPAREGAVGADAAGACLAVGSAAAATVAKSAETAPIATVSLGRARGCAWACFVGRGRALAGGATTSCGRMDGR